MTSQPETQKRCFEGFGVIPQSKQGFDSRHEFETNARIDMRGGRECRCPVEATWYVEVSLVDGRDHRFLALLVLALTIIAHFQRTTVDHLEIFSHGGAKQLPGPGYVVALPDEESAHFFCMGVNACKDRTSSVYIPEKTVMRS
jgi:hypothetical protein